MYNLPFIIESGYIFLFLYSLEQVTDCCISNKNIIVIYLYFLKLDIFKSMPICLDVIQNNPIKNCLDAADKETKDI